MIRTVLAVLWIAAGGASAQLIHFDFNGTAPSVFCGFDVDCAGDVDADGIPDFVVGSPYGSPTGTGGWGRADVFSGADGSTLYTWFGNAVGQKFGHAVAGVGDLDSDGHADLLIGTSNGTGAPGQARVHSGADGSILHLLNGVAAHDQFASSVAGAGDVDGDGVPDLVIGAPGEQNNQGSITVVSGATGAILYKRFGLAAFHYFGAAVSGCGDVDGDGYADLIVGAPQPISDIHPGYVHVFSGAKGLLLHSIQGSVIDSHFGFAVHGGVDLDLDGHADFIVGAPYASTNAGEVTVFSGATGLVLFGFSGVPYDLLGAAVRLVPDLNGDGRGDIVTGARAIVAGGPVRVRSGLDGTLLRVFGSVDGFGVSLSHAPDLNGDQFPEIIIGLPLSDLPSMADVGKAEVLSIVGARPYGIHSSQEMTLNWEPADTPGEGHLQVAFGVGLVPGILIASTGQSTTALGNQTILVDLTPGEWIAFPVPFNASGSASMPLDLTQPALDGTTFFVQAGQVLPATLLVSNGLQLLFSR